MSSDAVEEESVVRDDEHGASEAQDRLLQRAQRADVQVVRGLVEDEDLLAATVETLPITSSPLLRHRRGGRHLTKDADLTFPPSRTTDASCARFRSPPDRSLIFFDCSRDRKPNLRGTRVDPDAIDALPTHQSISTRIPTR